MSLIGYQLSEDYWTLRLVLFGTRGYINVDHRKYYGKLITLGGQRFTRYQFDIELTEESRSVNYQVGKNNYTINVPARGKPVNILYTSCNDSITDNWKEVLQYEYHIRVGGGDQIYINNGEMTVSEQYRKHFTEWSSDYHNVLMTIPGIAQLDDHDITDGYRSDLDGNYSMEFQYYLLIQNGILQSELQSSVSTKGLFGSGHWLRIVNNVALLGIDIRTTRTRYQIIDKHNWKLITKAIDTLPSNVSQIVLFIGVPVICPFIESLVISDFDDLLDRWQHPNHQDEKYNLVNYLSKLNQHVTIVSGDMHIGYSAQDHGITQLVSSPIGSDPGPDIWRAARIRTSKLKTINKTLLTKLLPCVGRKIITSHNFLTLTADDKLSHKFHIL